MKLEFRAWDTYKKKMFQVKGMRVIEETGAWEIWDGEFLIAPCLLHIMQFTGLLDKNGKKIFAGDVVRDITGLCVIEWHNNFASFCLHRKGWAFDHFFGGDRFTEDCEVIGNKFENPELEIRAAEEGF